MTLDLDMLSEEVLAAAALPMPFGRFKGTPLLDLPEPYVVWFKQQGYPSGHLGRQMALIYEIKANGLEKLLRPVLAAREQEAKPPPGTEPDSPVADADE